MKNIKKLCHTIGHRTLTNRNSELKSADEMNMKS